MKRFKKLATILLILSIILTTFSIQTVKISASTIPTCESHSQYVKLNQLDLISYRLVGTLCYQGTYNNKPLQLLMHGATYNSDYWDWQYQPDQYSYVRAATSSGYVTYNIDEVGSGQSDRPNGLLVGIDNTAFTVHQVVQSLRNGTLTGYRFNKIIGIGHSLGSGVAVKVGINYPSDFDGIILTGYAHNFNPLASTALATDFYDATLDPKFQGNLSALNYLTTVPGTRSSLFYDLNNSDPNVIALDENLKDLFAMKSFTDTPTAIEDPLTTLITVPVYIIDGDQDFLVCGGTLDCSNPNSLAQFEAPFFSPAAQLETSIVPNSGHDLNLNLSVGIAYSRMIDWSNRHFMN